MEVENDETSRQLAAALFEEHSPMMLKAAFKVTGNREDAKDVVQNVFAKVMQNWPCRSFTKNPGGYLYRAARNQARNLVRFRLHHDHREIDLDAIEIPGPEAESHRDDSIGGVRAALAKMKPRFVEILNLFYNEEYDCAQIAAMQGRLSATVFSDLCRARAQLKQLISIEENAQ